MLTYECDLEKLCVENLIPDVTVLTGGTFKRQLAQYCDCKFFIAKIHLLPSCMHVPLASAPSAVEVSL